MESAGNLSVFKAEFSETSLVNHLFITLGSDKIKAGLCIVAKRTDTNSTWFFLNHLNGKFYDSNKNVLLWKALRATSAAPSYFIPQTIGVGNGDWRLL